MSRVLNYITAPEVDEIVSNSQGGLVHDLARNVQAARRERDEARAALREVLDILRVQAPDIYEALDDTRRALGEFA
jgi:hypothetical protein